MKLERWRERAARAALVVVVVTSIPLLTLFLDVPAALLAACGSYYSCGGCTAGNPRPLCCVVVRAPFHPDSGPQCDPPNWTEPCGPEKTTTEACSSQGDHGIPTSLVVGTPTGDGTTGLAASPKYKSTVNGETVTFTGFVRMCPGSSGQAQQSWLCASGTAEVYLDEDPHSFPPGCADCGAGSSNIYCDGVCPNGVSTTCYQGWTDSLCPVEIGLASRLQDNKWHPLKIVYRYSWTPAIQPLSYHVPACSSSRNSSGTWMGVTLFLGCDIDIRDSSPPIPRIPVPNKFQRVDLRGVPVPERSPTGEVESDQPKNGFLIDVYNLAPVASFPEVSIPLEGGELALEFRRDGGVRTAHTSANTTDLPITYPTDDLLGLGWGSNLSARAIISRNGLCPAEPPRVTITDSGGTVYQYLLEIGNRFRPEVYDSQANAAISATPTLAGTILTLKLKHGTQYIYTCPPSRNLCRLKR